ncbi:MAG: aldehyde dehydrogenase family protein, partial [Candidatus Cloacimonetes bacterium]|nr:aldehyde dehydrogenase family protein [Candidatus Cloacimonadota bacterium]
MDKDLASVQEVRDMLRKAREAADQFKTFSQDQVDRIVQAMAERSLAAAKRLAEMAVEETGYGRAEDKTTKNVFASRHLLEHIQPIRTCGIVHHDETNKVVEIAVPMGIVAALVPCTNPTSTAIYKTIIALKARNAIVFSPHPKALNCILESVRILGEAAASVGAPRNLVQ